MVAAPAAFPIYKVDPALAELCKTGPPQWIVVTWDANAMNDRTNKQLHDAPPLDALPARTPPAVRDLLGRLLAKRPEDRPAEPTKVEAEAAKILEMLPTGSGYMSLDFRLRTFLHGARWPGETRHQAWIGAMTPFVAHLFVFILRALLAANCDLSPPWGCWRLKWW